MFVAILIQDWPGDSALTKGGDMKKRMILASSEDYNRVINFFGRRESVIHERRPEENSLVVETTAEVISEMAGERMSCDHGIKMFDV
jgi:hypothetical protein